MSFKDKLFFNMIRPFSFKKGTSKPEGYSKNEGKDIRGGLEIDLDIFYYFFVGSNSFF